MNRSCFGERFSTKTGIEELMEDLGAASTGRDKVYMLGGGNPQFNVGINVGKPAGQTIMHVHIHMIPRYRGDVENPRGGVRGVIPSKQSYSIQGQ